MVLLAGLLLRMLSTFAAVCGGGLTFKEKMFMVVAWLPKATAQVINVAFIPLSSS